MPGKQRSVTVIIPCYNQAHFLGAAIESIPVCLDAEVIVVDDGSSDDTYAICEKYPEVVYVRQLNKGLAAARNTGFRHSNSPFVIFLDADDMLIAEGITKNLACIRGCDTLGFISGGHLILQEDGSFNTHYIPATGDHYLHMLNTNYIGTTSGVIFRKEILGPEPYSTDPMVKGCEDYELYLRLARNHPVRHVPFPVCVYRRHESNMSNNHIMMLNAALGVLLKHKGQLRNMEEAKAWQSGWNGWLRHYGYFPLSKGKKSALNIWHVRLARKLGTQFPLVLLKKLREIIENKMSRTR